MSGQRSKPAREIFLTSSSLSFSSLSSSCASWDDAIELNTKACFEEHKGKLANGSAPGQLKNKGYDPERIPASVFAKSSVDLNWSEISSDSLFSIKMEGCRASNFRQSNITAEDLLMSGEFLAYSPFLSIKTETEEDICAFQEAQVIKAVEPKTRTHQEKASFSAPDVLCSIKPSKKPYTFGHAPLPAPVAEKKRKKSSKNKGRILSWLSSRCSKSERDLCCFKWSYCPRPKALLY